MGLQSLVEIVEGRHLLNPKSAFNGGEESLIGLGKSLLLASVISPDDLEFPIDQRYQKVSPFSEEVTSYFNGIIKGIDSSVELAEISRELMNDPDWSIDFDVPEALIRGLVAYQIGINKVDEAQGITGQEKEELTRALDSYYFTLFFHSIISLQDTEKAQGMMDHQGNLGPQFQPRGEGFAISVIEHFSRDLNLGKKVHVYQSLSTLSGVAQIIESIAGRIVGDRSYDWLPRALYFLHIKEVVNLAEKAKVEFRDLGMLLAVTNENGRKRTRDSANRAFTNKPFRRNSPFSLDQVVHMGIVWKAAIQGLDLNFHHNPERLSLATLAGLGDNMPSEIEPRLCEMNLIYR